MAETIISQQSPETRRLPQPLYVDYNLEVGVYGSEPLNYDQEAVLGAVYNILGIRPGERLWMPEFGSRVRDILFDPIHEDTAFELRVALIRAIQNWEPRASVDYQNTLVIEDQELSGYWATVPIRIAGLDVDLYRIFMKRVHT